MFSTKSVERSESLYSNNISADKRIGHYAVLREEMCENLTREKETVTYTSNSTLEARIVSCIVVNLWMDFLFMLV